MKIYHILNGDCLAQNFPSKLEGEVMIWRECLVEGKVNEIDFFEIRKEFFLNNYDVSAVEYDNKVMSEFSKIMEIPNNSKVFLWFEDDLFCQANLWFLISQISDKTQNLSVVLPTIMDKKSDGKALLNLPLTCWNPVFRIQ